MFDMCPWKKKWCKSSEQVFEVKPHQSTINQPEYHTIIFTDPDLSKMSLSSLLASLASSLAPMSVSRISSTTSSPESRACLKRDISHLAHQQQMRSESDHLTQVWVSQWNSGPVIITWRHLKKWNIRQSGEYVTTRQKVKVMLNLYISKASTRS